MALTSAFLLLLAIGFGLVMHVSSTKAENYEKIKKRNYELQQFFIKQGYDPRENEILIDGLTLLSFSWKSCGSNKDPLQIFKLSIVPDPIHLPGYVNFSFVGDVSRSVAAPVKAEIVVFKKMFIWIKVPCIDNVGSCTYDDVCLFFSQQTCPEPFIKYKIPCFCPVKKGTYSLPPSNMYLDPKNIPHALLNGKYQVIVKLSMQGVQLGCYSFLFSLSS